MEMRETIYCIVLMSVKSTKSSNGNIDNDHNTKNMVIK